MTDVLRTRLRGEHCVYCGLRPNSDEHFPPQSYGNLGYIIPACKECNTFAGTAHPLNFKKRVEYVKAQIKRHAPRFTFNTDMTLEMLLDLPERSWISELAAQKEMLQYRRRHEWNALAYVSTLTRRKKFVSVFASEDFPTVNENIEELALSASIGTAPSEIETSKAMQDAHLEELLNDLIEALPHYPRRKIAELEIDDVLAEFDSHPSWACGLNSEEMQTLYIHLVANDEIVDLDKMLRISRSELIDLIKPHI